MVNVFFKKVHPNAVLPTNNEGDSGWDVYAVEDVLMPVDCSVFGIHTGLQLAWLTPGFEIQVRSRSGNTLKKNVVVANQPGTVDNNYRGEIIVLMHMTEQSKMSYLFRKGDKIAQLVPMEVPLTTIQWREVVEETTRGSGGFGSTGQ